MSSNTHVSTAAVSKVSFTPLPNIPASLVKCDIDFNTLSSTITTLWSTVASLQQTCVQMSTHTAEQMRGIDKAIQAIQRNNIVLGAEMKSTSHSLLGLTSRVDQIEKKVDSLFDKTTAEIQAKTNPMSMTILELQNTVNILTSSMNSLTERVEKNNDGAQARTHNIEQTSLEIKQENKRLSGRFDMLNVMTTELEQKLNRTESNISKMNEDITLLSQQSQRQHEQDNNQNNNNIENDSQLFNASMFEETKTSIHQLQAQYGKLLEDTTAYKNMNNIRYLELTKSTTSTFTLLKDVESVVIAMKPPVSTIDSLSNQLSVLKNDLVKTNMTSYELDKKVSLVTGQVKLEWQESFNTLQNHLVELDKAKANICDIERVRVGVRSSYLRSGRVRKEMKEKVLLLISVLRRMGYWGLNDEATFHKLNLQNFDKEDVVLSQSMKTTTTSDDNNEISDNNDVNHDEIYNPNNDDIDSDVENDSFLPKLPYSPTLSITSSKQTQEDRKNHASKGCGCNCELTTANSNANPTITSNARKQEPLYSAVLDESDELLLALLPPHRGCGCVSSKLLALTVAPILQTLREHSRGVDEIRELVRPLQSQLQAQSQSQSQSQSGDQGQNQDYRFVYQSLIRRQDDEEKKLDVDDVVNAHTDTPTTTQPPTMTSKIAPLLALRRPMTAQPKSARTQTKGMSTNTSGRRITQQNDAGSYVTGSVVVYDNNNGNNELYEGTAATLKCLSCQSTVEDASIHNCNHTDNNTSRQPRPQQRPSTATTGSFSSNSTRSRIMSARLPQRSNDVVVEPREKLLINAGGSGGMKVVSVNNNYNMFQGVLNGHYKHDDSDSHNDKLLLQQYSTSTCLDSDAPSLASADYITTNTPYTIGHRISKSSIDTNTTDIDTPTANTSKEVGDDSKLSNTNIPTSNADGVVDHRDAVEHATYQPPRTTAPRPNSAHHSTPTQNTNNNNNTNTNSNTTRPSNPYMLLHSLPSAPMSIPAGAHSLIPSLKHNPTSTKAESSIRPLSARISSDRYSSNLSGRVMNRKSLSFDIKDSFDI